MKTLLKVAVICVVGYVLYSLVGAVIGEAFSAMERSLFSLM